MNPGPVEEAGKTAGLFMQIMKDQPLSLALVIMNIALLALFWYIARTQSELRSHDIELIFKQQKDVQELLSKCIIPDRRSDLLREVIPLPPPRPSIAND